jgi:ABC-type lipoprotein export system ATPase subunit
MARPAVATATADSSMDVMKAYGAKPSAVHAVRKVNLDVGFGEFVGPQTVGVGEDRAAEPIGVIEPTTSERIVVAGTDIARLGEGARTAHRRDQVGFVFSSSGWYSRRPVG